MNDTITETKPLVAIVKPTEHTQKYLAHIRRRMNAVTSDRERAGYAIIALVLQASLKERK